MISDCVEVDELMSGERREGLFYSMATVSQKLAAASGVSVLGMIIDYIEGSGGIRAKYADSSRVS